MSIPQNLFTPEIKTYIKDLIRFDDAKDFNSLDEFKKDHLVALGMQAFDGDIDIVLNSDSNKNLTNYLFSYDPCDRIELLNSIRESAREKFGVFFNQMIEDQAHERSCN